MRVRTSISLLSSGEALLPALKGMERRSYQFGVAVGAGFVSILIDVQTAYSRSRYGDLSSLQYLHPSPILNGGSGTSASSGIRFGSVH
jgi:hypothetical protein